FPDILKEGKIVPLPKTSNPKNFSELRPITILPVLEKYLKKLKKRSTELAILNLMHKFVDAIRSGKMIGVLLLDLKRAFEIICH
ncbi:rna-directed dna polymerase from mobile element jockey-like protein, partial [Dinothrombium tinctorium]